MKKIIFACVVMASAVGVSANQQTNECCRCSQLEAKIEQLEKRIGALEDEFGIERTKTPEEIACEEAEKAKKIATEAEIDGKVDAFLKEYFGVQIGQDASAFTNEFSKYRGDCKLPVLKKFDYFDRANGLITEGKLTGVFFYAEFDRKFSKDSVSRQVEASVNKILSSLGATKKRLMSYGTARYAIRERGLRETSRFSMMASAPVKCGIEIRNMKLSADLLKVKKDKENSSGEMLPSL